LSELANAGTTPTTTANASNFATLVPEGFFIVPQALDRLSKLSNGTHKSGFRQHDPELSRLPRRMTAKLGLRGADRQGVLEG